MLRIAVDETERLGVTERLIEACGLMKSALALLDATPVATDCDAFLDNAIHNLTNAIAQVQAGEAVFTLVINGFTLS